ncbi:MAG: Primosomal protein N [Petrotoga mobilis]|nr:MAG: Primosomal protein N [Petrotoga mobilis]
MYYYEVIPIGHMVFNGFTYKSDKKLEIGQRVIVDLRGKFISGLIYKESESTEFNKIKEIAFPLDNKSLLNESHIRLMEKVSSKFMAPIGEVARLFFPPLSSDIYKLRILPKSSLAPIQKPVFYKQFLQSFDNTSKANKQLREYLDSNLIEIELYRKEFTKKIDKFVSLKMDLKETWKFNVSKTAREVINYLSINGETLESDLYSHGIMKKGSTVLNTLWKKGIIELSESSATSEENIEVSLSEEQRQAVKSIQVNPDKPHLLYGVTGSGKTEVFFEVAKPILKNGGKVLLLVPEISLTSELMNRLKKRFANYNAAFYHSGLTSSERVQTWYKAVNGELDLVIGTRSAIFIPMKDLKMIIIDEEHDQSYYQIENVSYDAIDTACFRKELEDIQLILSSATPRMVDLHMAKTNSFYLEKIKTRYFTEMPEVQIVDMKKDEKYNWIFSKKVVENIEISLKRNKKIIVFTPTRGYANYVICSDCGYIFKCDECDVSLTFHKKERKLSCHYCGKESELPNFCPKCGGFKLQSRGFGTERVLSELAKLFPSQPLVRVDRTVIKTFKDLQNTFNFMKEPGKKIVVGTKMITKGLDIQDLDLVVILDADRYINFPDYNAQESTASLLMQVAGRSGRKERGKVIIQSFQPENNIYKSLIDHNFDLIAKNDLEQRKIYGYPPFVTLFLILVNHPSADKAKAKANEIVEELGKIENQDDFEILGPVVPIISKLRGNHRNQIIIKSKKKNHEFLFSTLKTYYKDIKIYVNPPTTLV